MGILLGLAAALGWGIADFLARYATRLTGAYRTLFYMQILGFSGLSVYLLGSGELARLASDTTWQPWAWGLVVGLLNVASSLALYRAFEIGVLALVSPISASYAALTVLLALASGETLSPGRALGIVATLIGVVLTATSLTAPRVAEGPMPGMRGALPRGMLWAMGAACGYGVAYWLLGFRVASVLGGVLPVWIIRLTSLGTLALFARPARQSLRPPSLRVCGLIGGVGLLDTAAFIANATGLGTSNVAIVSVLASLFSAVTVILAWLVLRERLAWNQWLGICTIFAGITLISR